MRCIMIMFDSLNRHMLPPYGCDWVHAPNFKRLAGRSVTFDNAYVGPMPCMPARRELHTGRYNFLHRSWGPLEPFDDSMPQILKDASIYTHLTSDHQHYWEDGGATYHTRYNTWQISRGQEGDPCFGQVRDPEIPPVLEDRPGSPHWRQDWINRQRMPREEDQPQAVTFTRGLEFIDTNHSEDNWFLHIETFDPHEPYFTQQHYKDLYEHGWTGPHFDWPSYRKVSEQPEAVEHMRRENAALVSMCDHWLGTVLDRMDRYNLWDDTLLIVNTDHGFLLGEHDWWAKCRMPFYNEIARTPLFIHDPRCTGAAGARRQSLVQTIDLPATILEYFGQPLPADMQGVPLKQTMLEDAPVRDAALYGLHGGHVNCTDGRYTYMRGPVEGNTPLYEYTLMPTHMRGFFSVDELQQIELAEPFGFTKGCRTMKIAARQRSWTSEDELSTKLYDLHADPGQQHPLDDEAAERRMIELMVEAMKAGEAPPEQYRRLGLS